MRQKKRKFVSGLAAVTLAASLVILVQPGWCMDAEDAPESVEINSLANLYSAVEFDHAAHVAMAECSDCHHHTTGTGPAAPTCARCHSGTEVGDTVSCRECHATEPFIRENLEEMDNPEIFHVDKPGLKGAYHINCLGCHQEVAGPTGCQDCHQMTEAGEKRFNSGPYAPAGYSLGAESHESEKRHE